MLPVDGPPEARTPTGTPTAIEAPAHFTHRREAPTSSTVLAVYIVIRAGWRTVKCPSVPRWAGKTTPGRWPVTTCRGSRRLMTWLFRVAPKARGQTLVVTPVVGIEATCAPAPRRDDRVACAVWQVPGEGVGRCSGGGLDVPAAPPVVLSHEAWCGTSMVTRLPPPRVTMLSRSVARAAGGDALRCGLALGFAELELLGQHIGVDVAEVDCRRDRHLHGGVVNE
jgi:hypothetical protein